ncbi:MAG TPA: ABC transporter permease [Blastocatellia bacterium]|nr:ABC transporter permease [Blastocatellia bacterium]
MENIWHDLRYGVRMMFKNPGFTVVAIVTLALGIGANTAIFSVVNAVLLRPLPYEDSNRLVWFWENQPDFRHGNLSPADFLDYQAQSRAFEQIASYRRMDFTLTGDRQPEQISGLIVSANYFSLLGIQPELGRVFQPEDGRAGATRVAVVSHGFWQRRFAGEPNLIGKALTLSGQAVTIVGIAPPGLKTDRVELWLNPRNVVPDMLLTTTRDPATMRGAHYLHAIGRLNPGVALTQAQEEINALSARLQEQYPATNAGHTIELVSLLDKTVGKLRPALLVLLGAVGLVLLIACANVANLMLARATARHKEIALRRALGASRWRVIRQLLTESLTLAALGGACGCLLAVWGVDLLVATSPESIPRLHEIEVDRQVLGFTLLISLATGIIFGLAPALIASGTDLNEALKEGGRSATAGSSRGRMRGALVVGEVALALLVLVGAGLLVRSFVRLHAVDPGFQPANLLTMRLFLTDAKYATNEPRLSFMKELTARLEALPGVQGVGISDDLPIEGTDSTMDLTIEGREPAPGERLMSGVHVVNPRYFEAMGIPLLEGRVFTERDTLEAPTVLVVNETMSRRLWPGQEAVGKRVKLGDPNGEWVQIVGVVRDVKHNGLSAEPAMDAYASHLQVPWPWMTIALRSNLDPTSLEAAVRREVQAIDPNKAVASVKTMDQLIRESVGDRRLSLVLFGLFAVVALLLAAVGIYGVMAYGVTQRTHEIGLRVALGAQPRDVVKLVVGRGMTLALTGVALGVGAAFGLTRLMASLLFEVSTTDSATFLVIALVLAGVALLACYVPARRATKVDPMVALRHE